MRISFVAANWQDLGLLQGYILVTCKHCHFCETIGENISCGFSWVISNNNEWSCILMTLLGYLRLLHIWEWYYALLCLTHGGAPWEQILGLLCWENPGLSKFLLLSLAWVDQNIGLNTSSTARNFAFCLLRCSWGQVCTFSLTLLAWRW